MSEEFTKADEIKAVLAHQRSSLELHIESCRESLRKHEEMEGWEGFPPEIAEPLKEEVEQNLTVAEASLVRVEALERYMEQYSS